MESINFENVNSSVPFCPLALQKLQLSLLEISLFSEKSNLSFIDMSFADQAIISNIDIVSSNISLTNKLVSNSIIKKVSGITFDRVDILNAKSGEMFKGLKNLNNITFVGMNFNKLMKRNTLQTMLEHVNTDLRSNGTFDPNIFSNALFFPLVFKYGNNFNITDDKFCIYKDFPFDRYVVPFFFGPVQNECSCAFRFLNIYAQFFKEYVDVSLNECLLNIDFYDDLLKCNIDRRIAACNMKENRTVESSKLKYNDLINAILNLEPVETTTTVAPSTDEDDF